MAVNASFHASMATKVNAAIIIDGNLCLTLEATLVNTIKELASGLYDGNKSVVGTSAILLNIGLVSIVG
jgi:hypothetical protein